ncbi:uncharacterized protein F5891DRAFT_1180564 [Suillus fuscotomentosus]|uniref:Uncharacterized protein n=1 Tax=Suillus fuscotomentosus TaxID=1912939 RepID=A0AAD4EJV7_9AGAM|nr:uncharacterized protein F5891DRAFT_1180564 [Suillus fuscotomentosus]KAG1907555.1 hypothetical protein F5891DRAFT_1180564 [Suillus fuscotomentosus]
MDEEGMSGPVSQEDISGAWNFWKLISRIWDEQGVSVSAQRAKTIRNLMLSSFRELDTQGLAPDSIGQASLQVLHWLIHTLRKHCLELCLCADNWKVMKLMTDNYSQWFNYHVKKRTSKRIKAEHGESIPDLSEDALPSVQKCRGNSDQDLEAEHPKKRVRTDLPVIEPIIENDEVREPTPPPHANKGKDKEVTTIEIENPLSNVVLKPRPKAVNQMSPSISIDSPTASTSGTNPILALPSHESTPTSTIPNTPLSTDTASLAVKAELINQASTTIETKVHPNMIKKCQPSTKPMCMSSKIMARNFCAIEWQSNGHQKEPVSIFATYWNGLSSTNKEVYKCKAALQLNSAGTTEGSGACDDMDEE